MDKLALVLLVVIAAAMLADAAYPAKDKLRMQKEKAMAKKKMSAKMDKRMQLKMLEASKRSKGIEGLLGDTFGKRMEADALLAAKGQLSAADYKEKARQLKDEMKREYAARRTETTKDKTRNKRGTKEAMKRERSPIKRKRKIQPEQ